MTLTQVSSRAIVRRQERSGPWPADQLSRLVMANGAGFVLIIAGWYQASGTGSPAEQMGWLGLGIGGLFVAGVANALWILRIRSLITDTTEALLTPLVGDRSLDPSTPATTMPSRPILERPRPQMQERRGGSQLLVAAEGTSRYHRPDCVLVAGKPVRIADVATHERAGRRPCEACEP